MKFGDVKKVPEDFPREENLCALARLQPEVGIRQGGGESTTEDELYERHDVCEGLVVQLIGYGNKKPHARPAWDLSTLLKKVRTDDVSQKGWDLSAAEFEWVMFEVSKRMPGRSPTG